MGQHAGLGGDGPAGLDVVEALQHPGDALHAVVHRVQAQHRVPDAEGEALEQGGHDAVRVVGGVVGLEPGGQGAGLADGGVAGGGDPDLFGGVDEVQVAHQLGHGGHHLAGEAPGDAPDGGPVVLFVQNPLPQLGHRPVLDFSINFLVHVVLDDAGDLVGLIGDGGGIAQVGQGQVGQHHLGGHPLLGVLGGDARQPVARLLLIGLGHDLTDRLEVIDVAQQLGF